MILKTIKHYASVYQSFLSTCIAESLTYRLNFALIFVMDLIFAISILSPGKFMIDAIGTIGVWDEPHLMFFLCFMICLDQFHMFIVSANFWEFSVLVRSGGLDYILLRPLGSIFNIFFRYQHLGSIVNLIFVLPVLIKYGLMLNFHIYQWILFPIMLLLALILMVIIDILFCAFMFWIIDGTGINFLRMGLQDMSRQPDFIYKYYIRKIFTFFIPVLMVGSFPVKFLFNLYDYQLVFIMLIAIITLLLLLSFIWKRGLIKYESASS